MKRISWIHLLSALYICASGIVLFFHIRLANTGDEESSSKGISQLVPSLTTTTTTRGVKTTTRSSTTAGYPSHDDFSALPQWISDYVKWHNQIRKKYPGEALFNHPDAPNLLIRTCTIKCGGLNDRLGKLPWDIYLANQTQRIMLIHWCQPAPLQDFLLPNRLDWTIPTSIQEFWDAKTCKRKSNRTPDLFHGFKSTRPGDNFWQSEVDIAIHRATDGEHEKTKTLRHNILGREDKLERRLGLLGEDDTIVGTTTYGKIFWLFFKPHPNLAIALDTVYNALPDTFTAVHCRVRHPMGISQNTTLSGKMEKRNPDQSGLLWDSQGQQFAVEIAVHALQCAVHEAFEVSKAKQETVFFYSDSADLASFVASKGRESTSRNVLLPQTLYDEALRTLSETNIVVRQDTGDETLHIDRQVGRNASAYMPSFVDLLIAAKSSCMVGGLGNYAAFASRLSGSKCMYLHQQETWGTPTGVLKNTVATSCKSNYANSR